MGWPDPGLGFLLAAVVIGIFSWVFRGEENG